MEENHKSRLYNNKQGSEKKDHSKCLFHFLFSVMLDKEKLTWVAYTKVKCKLAYSKTNTQLVCYTMVAL